MSINQIDNNGKSKIISSKTGVMGSANNGISSKAHASAPSHTKKALVNLGHASHPNTGRDNEGKKHESSESKSFEKGEDRSSSTKKVLSDKKGGSY